MQTFKFGLNAKRIENKTTKNVIANNSEETLKLLIQEYHSRLASSDISRDDRLPMEYEDLKSENKILLEQLHKFHDTDSHLLTISINENNEVELDNKNGVNSISEMEIVKKCVEALKIKCKESYIWKTEAKELRENNVKFNSSMPRSWQYFAPTG